MFIEFQLALLEGSAWSNMFVLDHTEVTWLEKIIRPILVYLSLLIIFRIFGNRELGQLNPMDLIVLLLLSNTVQNAIIGEDSSLVGGLVGSLALVIINYAMVYLKFKSEWFERFVEGVERVLIKDGKVDEQIRRKEMMTKSDMDTLAHEKDLDGTDKIEKCVIDTNGTFLVMGKDKAEDENFKKDVLEKIDKLTAQLSDLQKALQRS